MFARLHGYMHEARHRTGGVSDERSLMAGLRLITSNVRDCFLVDQLVFLEKQVDSVASIQEPL